MPRDGQNSEHIPGSLSDSVFEGLQHEKSRQHILSIIKDYTDHTDFMDKVRKYAGQELDQLYSLDEIPATLTQGGSDFR